MLSISTSPKDWSKLKAFADNKINVAKMMTALSDRVENIVVKKKMLVTSIVAFSNNVFKGPSCQGR